MKFALKSLVAAVAIASIGNAFAATASGVVGQAVQVKDPLGSGRIAELTLLSGTGALYFSNGNGTPTTNIVDGTAPGGLIGALNVGGVQLTGVDEAKVIESSVTYGGRTKVTERGNSRIEATVTKLTANIDGANAGQFTIVNAKGGATQLAAPKAGVLGGGNATVNNLEIDLIGKVVYADVSSNPGTDFAFAQKRMAVWNITDISGPTAITPEALLKAGSGDSSGITALGFTVTGEAAAQAGFSKTYFAETTNVLSGLKITTEGFKFFQDALDITQGGTAYNTLLAVNNTAEGWGSLKSNIKFSAREVLIPEPSTYALMGLGLVGISLVARRRAK